MTWWNPWGEIRMLKDDLQEALTINREYFSAKQALARDFATLRDANWSLTIENKRLGSLMERAVFRDPDTGRLLPKGRQH